MFNLSKEEITFEVIQRHFVASGKKAYALSTNKKSQKTFQKSYPLLRIHKAVFLSSESKLIRLINKVLFPIEGIPKTPGLEERIVQSAITGIYPSVMPEVILIDVPDSDNVVVVVRVDESIQAPHAIQNSAKVYIRTGSVTQPYELSDIDRIEYMLKRPREPKGRNTANSRSHRRKSEAQRNR